MPQLVFGLTGLSPTVEAEVAAPKVAASAAGHGREDDTHNFLQKRMTIIMLMPMMTMKSTTMPTTTIMPMPMIMLLRM